jgi:chaperonin cofactor prefoldin
MGKVKTMEKSTKVTQEELTQLQTLVTEFNNIQIKVGDLEIQKHQLLHRIGSISTALESLQGELKSKYGDVVVDINTGDLKEASNEVSS